MATPPAPPAPIPNPALLNATTRRGIAASSLCLGLWSLAVFWWYPYAAFISIAGLVLGSVAVVKDWRGGRDGENMAVVGCVLCSITLGSTFAVYRLMQIYFEGYTPTFP